MDSNNQRLIFKSSRGGILLCLLVLLWPSLKAVSECCQHIHSNDRPHPDRMRLPESPDAHVPLSWALETLQGTQILLTTSEPKHLTFTQMYCLAKDRHKCFNFNTSLFSFHTTKTESKTNKNIDMMLLTMLIVFINWKSKQTELFLLVTSMTTSAIMSLKYLNLEAFLSKLIMYLPTYLWIVWLIKSENHVIHLITFVIRLTALSKTTIKQMISCN